MVFVEEVAKYPMYIKLYSGRHKIPAKIIQDNSVLNACAFNEFQSGIGKISITEARRNVVKQFPKLNTIPTSAPLVSASGYLFTLSVLSLICPHLKPHERSKVYEDWYWDIPTTSKRNH